MRRFLAALLLALWSASALAFSGPQVSVVTPAYQAPGWTGWTPATVATAWWTADDHGTARMTDDGAGVISSWTDNIAGLAVTAATTARPTWSATGLFSAYPALTFDGTANQMANTSISGVLPTGATAGEICVVADQTATTAGFRVAVSYGGNGTAQRTVDRNFPGSINRALVSDASTNLTNTGAVYFGPTIHCGVWNGTSMTGRQNGAPFALAATITTINTGTTRLRIGALADTSVSLFWLGPIREVVITTLLSAANDNRLDGYLAASMGRSYSLPWNHPYRQRRP